MNHLWYAQVLSQVSGFTHHTCSTSNLWTFAQSPVDSLFFIRLNIILPSKVCCYWHPMVCPRIIWIFYLIFYLVEVGADIHKLWFCKKKKKMNLIGMLVDKTILIYLKILQERFSFVIPDLGLFIKLPFYLVEKPQK